MTEAQAYQFWSEWIALKARWGIESVYATTDETCSAQFSDGSTIDIDGRSLSIGDLKAKESPIQVQGNDGACSIELQINGRLVRYVGRTPAEVLEIKRANEHPKT